MTAQLQDTDLVQQLADRGLLSPWWRQVWDRVPREAFIPSAIWRQLPDRCEPVTDTKARARLINSDEPIVTQIDDGRDGGPGIATSSNSMPSMVARMLRLLEVHDRDRVLEIGTATGHVAALLSERLGDSNVVSVEIDAGLSGQAKENCSALGHSPTLIAADGELGWAAGAPYDALVSTCALRHVPHALVEQVRPGGVIVAPLARDFWTGVLVQLTVEGDGFASGSFRGGASYMPMKSHRSTGGIGPEESTGRIFESTLDPRRLLSVGCALYAGARMPDVTMIATEDGATVRVWLQDRTGSAAVAGSAEDVWQYGPRDLWAELEGAHQEYVLLGEPDSSQFGLTVTPEGQEVWLTEPKDVITPAG